MEQDADPRFAQLYPRQLECLRLTFERKTSKEIATTLGISVGTTDKYIAGAVKSIGARNRRDAAEKLWKHERQNTPCKMGDDFTGIAADDAIASTPLENAGSLGTQVLPFRKKDVIANDLSIIQRIAWVPAIAVAFAIGFGALASGLHIVSDIVAAFRGAR